MNDLTINDLKQIDQYRWLLPKQGRMRTDGLLFLNEKLLEHIKNDKSITQVANVACLPGIVGRSLAMPDMHQGYGFPIGGVAAFDTEKGVIRCNSSTPKLDAISLANSISCLLCSNNKNCQTM